MDLDYAPPTYPGHSYTGEGEIVTVRLGSEIVGHLSRQDWDKLGWLARPALSEDANTVRLIVEDLIAKNAREGRPMVDAYADVLNHTQHDKPVTARLDGLQG
jgi:hypothetical protein